MLFEILPVFVYQMAGSGLTDLPVEMVASILRYVDPNSLLNAVKAYKMCKDVCLGDQILRRRLKRLVAEERRLDMERGINPAMGIAVTRSESTKIFGQNVMKNIELRVFPRTGNVQDVTKDFFPAEQK